MLKKRSVFFHLALELKSGDICVISSEDYADYREQLLSRSDFQPLFDEYCENLNLPKNPDDFINHLKSWLSETAKIVDEGYPQNSQVVIDEDGEPVVFLPPASKTRESKITSSWANFFDSAFSSTSATQTFSDF